MTPAPGAVVLPTCPSSTPRVNLEKIGGWASSLISTRTVAPAAVTEEVVIVSCPVGSVNERPGASAPSSMSQPMQNVSLPGVMSSR
jgi:hypothetical protein